MTDELKQILTAPRKAHNRAMCKKEALEDLKLLILPSGISYDAIKVQTSMRDKMPEYVERHTELTKEYEEEFRAYLDAFKRAEYLIDHITHKDIHRTMYEHYLLGATFERIATESSCDVRTVYRWRSSGEKILENALEKERCH